MGHRPGSTTTTDDNPQSFVAEVEQVLRQAWTPRPQPQPVTVTTASCDTARLVIAEEQQILRQAFQSYFVSQPEIEVVGSSGDTAGDSLSRMASALSPDVMVLGFRALDVDTVDKLEMVRESNPDVSLLVLSAYYEVKGLMALRELFRSSDAGCAYLLKYTIDTVEQLTQVVQSAGEGRIILDPAVMEGLIANADTTSTVLKELSPREMEVLSWMSKRYRNGTIAEVMCLEPKTVERHINSIYSKLGENSDSKHMRVHTTTLYLKATGQLPNESFGA